MTHQLSLIFDEARALGAVAGGLCLDATSRDDPFFKGKARANILAYLGRVGQASCEDITDAAIAAGAFTDRPRAFGPIYCALARESLIVVVGYTKRRKGRGTFGATVYELAATLPPALPDAPTQVGGDLNGGRH
jgi:hypothetical protein